MKKLRFPTVIWLAIFLFIAIAGSLSAESEPIVEISAPEVKIMLEKGEAVVIHVLSEIEFNIQHIPGSINIPIIKMKTTDKLPKDKDTPLIFYCMGVR